MMKHADSTLLCIESEYHGVLLLKLSQIKHLKDVARNIILTGVKAQPTVCIDGYLKQDTNGTILREGTIAGVMWLPVTSPLVRTGDSCRH